MAPDDAGRGWICSAQRPRWRPHGARRARPLLASNGYWKEAAFSPENGVPCEKVRRLRQRVSTLQSGAVAAARGLKRLNPGADLELADDVRVACRSIEGWPWTEPFLEVLLDWRTAPDRALRVGVAAGARVARALLKGRHVAGAGADTLRTSRPSLTRCAALYRRPSGPCETEPPRQS